MPVMIIGIIALNQMIASMETEITNRNTILVQSVAREVENFLSEHLVLLKQIEDLYDKSLISTNKFNAYLDSVLGNYKFFNMIQLLDETGKVLHLSPYNEDLAGIDMSGQLFFRVVQKQQKTFWSHTFISPETGQPTLTVSVPLQNRGVLVGYLNLEILNSIIKKYNFGSKGYVSVSDRDGIMIAHPIRAIVSQRMNGRHLEPVQRGMNGEEGTFRYTFQGEDKLESISIVPGTRWIIGMSQPVKEAFSSINKVSKIVAGATLLTLIFVIIISFLILKKALKPLFLLAENSKKIANGDYHVVLHHSHYREVDELASNFEEMTESIRNRENELKNLKNFLSNIINSMPSVIVGLDSKGMVTHWNHEAEKLSNCNSEQAIGKSLQIVFPDLDRYAEKINESIKSGVVEKIERFAHQSMGKIIYSDIVIYPLIENGVVGAVLRIDDVTTRVKLEEMMVHTEKMMSVGGLASGMAHEINNPLSIILQSIQNVERFVSAELPRNHEVAQEFGVTIEVIHAFLEKQNVLKLLGGIREACKRAADIVLDMLQFSHRTSSNKEFVDLRELINKTVAFVAKDHNQYKKYDFRKIKITEKIEEDLPQIWCNVTEIQQLLLNLLFNHAQALYTKSAGEASPEIFIQLQRDKDDFIQIETKDNGIGMDEETRKRIFEPFFTTKNVGVGTGLGLSISYFIITTNHLGTIRVESTKGKGTRFIIRLPIKEKKTLPGKTKIG